MIYVSLVLLLLLLAATGRLVAQTRRMKEQTRRLAVAAGLRQEDARLETMAPKVARLLADSHELARQEYLRRLFESLLNEIQQGVIIVDQRLQVKFANRTIARLFHRPAVQPGRPLLEEIQDHQLHRIASEALTTRRRQLGDLRFLPTAAGSDLNARHYTLEAAPLSTADEPGAWVMVQDITPQVMADQIRKDFVANASHELRTPLTLILGYIETLKDEPPDPDFLQQSLGIMEKHGQRIVRIIDDMLTISRLESAGSTLKIEPFNVRDCAQEAIDRLKPMLAGRDARIELDFPPDGGVLSGDRFYWDQIFTNLIENAVKENAAPGLVVKVRGEWESGNCTLTISDNGVGIPAHEIPFIFKRFFRGSRHAASGVKGTGLGLSIVRRAIEAHGGTIALQSIPGKETAFTLRVPVTGTAAGSASG